MKLLIVFLLACFALGTLAAKRGTKPRTWPVLAMSLLLAMSFLSLRVL